MPNNSILKTENIYKSYANKANKRTDVLKGISLNFTKGDYYALMGPSGAGKSTLLNLLGCLDNADSGEIVYSDGTNEIDYLKMTKTEKATFRNQKIGFVFQFHHLLPEFTALENVMMPALIAGLKYKAAKKKAEELLRIVDVDIRSDHKPMELSGGEQQRIAIARAIINSPDIILADEPTGNLDYENSKKVLELLLELKNNLKLTLIIATHSNEIASSSDRIINLRDGKLFESNNG